MKKVLLLALGLALVSPAQKTTKTHPNFSGTWELVQAKSDFGKIPPPKKLIDVVHHQGTKITVKSTTVIGSQEYTTNMNYTTTGQQDINFEPTGTRIKSRSRWVGSELVTEAEIELKGSVTRFKERWRLADRGKTFMNTRVINTKQGDVVQKLVYAKK